MTLPPELQDRLRHVRDLPSPPKLVSEIIDLAEDPNLSLISVASVVSKDPALTAKILRMANSPLYTRRRKSETLRQAMLVLGLNATLTVALSFSLAQSLRRQRGNALDYAATWKRALMAATAGRALAEVLERRDGEELFLAALLQDIGVLALDRALPDLYCDAPDPLAEHELLAEFEHERLCCDHAAVSAWLLARWHFPVRTILAAEHSHDPDTLPPGHEHASFARCVAVAGMLADLWVETNPAVRMSALAQRTEHLLGLDFTQLATVLAVMRNHLPETEALYETEMFDTVHAEILLDAAREIVTMRNLQVLEEAGRLRSRSHCADENSDGQRDAVTGLYTRAHLLAHLARELESAGRYDWPVSVACFRVDSSTPGLLNSIGVLLRSTLRDSDLLARYADGDLILVMSGTPREAAVGACRRMMKLLAEASLDDGGGNTYLGVMVWTGLACFDRPGSYSSAENLIRAAVRAMHAAVRDEEDGNVRSDTELGRGPDCHRDDVPPPSMLRRFFGAG